MEQKEAEVCGARRRVAAPFTDAELAEIDEWGFGNRIRDRSSVIRTLVRRGLDTQQPHEDQSAAR